MVDDNFMFIIIMDADGVLFINIYFLVVLYFKFVFILVSYRKRCAAKLNCTAWRWCEQVVLPDSPKAGCARFDGSHYSQCGFFFPRPAVLKAMTSSQWSARTSA